MQLGINWKKDTTLGKYRDLFTLPAIRQALGKKLQQILSSTGYIRYPGGTYVQELLLDEAEAESDYTIPGYPNFYQFCKEYNLRILQQLPTTKLAFAGKLRTIKSSVKEPIDWYIVDQIIQQTKGMIQWLNRNKLTNLVAYWEFGNEDYHDREGRLRPEEYVELIARYISSLDDLIPPDKLLIVARLGQRAGVTNWGADVLTLLKKRGFAESIGGITTHLYPYFLEQDYVDSAQFDFNEYCLSDRLIQSVRAEYQQYVDILSALEYPENIKIHITEFSIDIPGPIRRVDNSHTFGHNQKTYAGAVGTARIVSELATNVRFGSAAYYCLFHKYLLAPESQNPTPWKQYTTVNDWGWGQCWYVPQEPRAPFIITPVLEVWSILTRLLENATNIKKIDTQMYLAVANTPQTLVRLLWLNLSNNTKTLPARGSIPGLLIGNGNLDQRAVRLGSEGKITDRTMVTPQLVKLTGNVQLPPYSIFFAQGTDITLNNVPIVPEFIRTRARLNGKPVPLGEYSIQYRNGNFILSPEGVVLENYPLSAIINDNGLTAADFAHILFGTSPGNISEWQIYLNKESETEIFPG
ncbi:MAG: hypothetical protein N3A72_10300 [bacterium]|nr:hypothetical protein [bacterium]